MWAGCASRRCRPLAVGARVSLQARFEPAAWFDAVAQWKPTTTLLVPAVMKALIEHPRWDAADLGSLRFVNSGSQIVPRALIEPSTRVACRWRRCTAAPRDRAGVDRARAR